MSKNTHGRGYLFTQIMKTGAHIVRVGEYSVTVEFPGAADYRHIFSRGKHPHRLGMETPDGLVLHCKNCHCDHFLPWSDPDYLRAQERLQQRKGPKYINILCIDGERVQCALPGSQYAGRVTWLMRLIVVNPEKK